MREHLNQELLSRLIGLARATEGNEELITEETERVLRIGLTVLFDADGEADANANEKLYNQILAEKKRLVPNCFDCASPCGRTADYGMQEFRDADEERISLKLEILKRLGLGEVLDLDTILYALIVIGWNGSRESLQRVLDKLIL